MKWRDLEERAHELIDAHPDLDPDEYAQLLQQQFRDQPILGWLLLAQLGMPTDEGKPGEQHG